MRAWHWRAAGLLACVLTLLCGACSSASLEYFARAARWLRAKPLTHGRPVILYGVSRGGEGALLIASYEPHLFEAVIASSPSANANGAIGGSIGPAGSAWTFHGKPLVPGTEIPVGRIRVPLLIGDGGLDAVWNSATSASVIVTELQSAHDPAPYVNLYYPDAGHAIVGAPPYFPYADYGANGDFMGGSQQANALAMERSWARMIEFINDPWHP